MRIREQFFPVRNNCLQELEQRLASQHKSLLFVGFDEMPEHGFVAVQGDVAIMITHIYKKKKQ